LLTNKKFTKNARPSKIEQLVQKKDYPQSMRFRRLFPNFNELSVEKSEHCAKCVKKEFPVSEIFANSRNKVGTIRLILFDIMDPI
jgi:hypothetical protein